MKQFLRMFCLYLFILSCLPCNDGMHGHDAILDGGETNMLKEQHNCPTHEHCNDLCPPFCNCSCCGCVGSSERLASLDIYAPVINTASVRFAYQSPFSTAHFEAHFRPPISILG